MSASATLADLDRLIDEQRIGRRLVLVVLVAALALVGDGYDLAAMGYVAPRLARAWRLAPAAFVPAFSAAIVGMMVGGPLLGALGDRFGRKRLIVAGLGGIGLLTLATMAARTTTDLVLLRFATGIGLGGVIPNTCALVAEISPARARGRLLVAVTLGVPVGIALPGLVAATLAVRGGWRTFLLVGGVLPLAAMAACAAALPESLKYLAGRGGRPDRVRRALARLVPNRAGGFDAVDAHPPSPRGGFRHLFAGGLATVTPLLWFCQAANQMANFFALTWLPTLLQAGQAGGGHGGATAALFSLGGLVGGLGLLLVLDRLGTVPIVLLFLLGTPLVAALAATGLSPAVHALLIAGAGLCVTGVQVGITALLGIVYPTPVRSAGTGWTQAAGRVGALAAPVVGGVLLGLKVPLHRLPLAPAALMAVGTLACALLMWRCYRESGSLRAGEFLAGLPTATPGEAATLAS